MPENEVPARIQLLTDGKASGDPTLVTWLSRLKTNINTILRQLKNWINTHVSITPPYFLENPHKQYWHKILDPAWMTMYFEGFTTPKTVTNGQVITNFTGNTITDYQLVSSTAAGTVTIDDAAENSELGSYYISVNAFIDGGSNNSNVVTMYSNGSPTLLRMPLITKGSLTTGQLSYAGIGHVDSSTVVDLRLEAGASIDIYNISWSMHRINPIAGTTGFGSVVIADDPPSPEPIPPGWGGPP